MTSPHVHIECQKTCVLCGGKASNTFAQMCRSCRNAYRSKCAVCGQSLSGTTGGARICSRCKSGVAVNTCCKCGANINS